MGKYAEKTEVSPMRSLDEIDRMLTRYEADQFFGGRDNEKRCIYVTFRKARRQVRFTVPLPDPDDDDFQKVDRYSHKLLGFSQEKYDQAVRQRWRALTLVIKAKLESIESGIEDFETAFMGQLVLPNNQTVGEWMTPQIERAYENGKMPPMLGGGD